MKRHPNTAILSALITGAFGLLAVLIQINHSETMQTVKPHTSRIETLIRNDSLILLELRKQNDTRTQPNR